MDTRPRLSARMAQTQLSRRGFVGLAALTATALAGCGPLGLGSAAGSSVTPAATHPPAPIPPGGKISTANASAIKQLAAFTPNSQSIRGVAWSGDGRLLAAGTEGDIYLWDMTNPAFRTIWRGHTNEVYGMAWSPDGKLLASASLDGSVRLWAYGQRQAVRVLRDTVAISPISVSWSPDSARVACGTLGGNTIIWNAATGERLAKWSGPPMVGRGKGGRNPFAVWGVSWSPDGHTLATTRYDDLIQLWNVASGHATVLQKTDSQPNTIAWAPTGDTFATTDDDGKVQIWRAETGKIVTTLFDHSEAGWGYGLAWSPDAQLITATRETGLVQVWSVADGKQRFAAPAHYTSAWAAAWSPDNLRFATGGDDGKVCVWGV
ncbi:MAG TPA: WD40 repeat domain-containing protein [Ktedonobacterales bacterium]|nr:WD40 repeat domain-containing protein [Ktedonobacterales bacterium]